MIVVVLGIIGGIFGLIGAVFALLFGSFVSTLGGEYTILIGGIIAVLASISGIIGAVMAKDNPKRGGWIMIGSAILGFIGVFLAYLLAGILLMIAGIFALLAKSNKTRRQKKGGEEK